MSDESAWVLLHSSRPTIACQCRRSGLSIVPHKTGRKPMRQLTLAAAAIALVAASAPAQAQQQQPAATGPEQTTRYFTTPLEKDPSRVVRLQMQMHAPGKPGNPFHTHDGDQWQVVLEGEITFTVRGQPPR